MKKLGELMHVTKAGLLVVKSVVKDPLTVVGAIVYDRDMRRVGRVVDVIGRVDSPYIIVKPESKEILDFIEPGPLYYYIERRARRERKGKRRGRG